MRCTSGFIVRGRVPVQEAAVVVKVSTVCTEVVVLIPVHKHTLVRVIVLTQLIYSCKE